MKPEQIALAQRFHYQSIGNILTPGNREYARKCNLVFLSRVDEGALVEIDGACDGEISTFDCSSIFFLNGELVGFSTDIFNEDGVDIAEFKAWIKKHFKDTHVLHEVTFGGDRFVANFPFVNFSIADGELHSSYGIIIDQADLMKEVDSET